MPIALPFRSAERVDDFPLAAICWVVFVGIALGLTFGIADEATWLPPFSTTLEQAAGSQLALAEPLAGLQFAP